MQDRIVSIGFLTESDLQRLGENFTRHYPLVEDDQFDDLLAKLDLLTAGDAHFSDKHRAAQKIKT